MFHVTTIAIEAAEQASGVGGKMDLGGSRDQTLLGIFGAGPYLSSNVLSVARTLGRNN